MSSLSQLETNNKVRVITFGCTTQEHGAIQKLIANRAVLLMKIKSVKDALAFFNQEHGSRAIVACKIDGITLNELNQLQEYPQCLFFKKIDGTFKHSLKSLLTMMIQTKNRKYRSLNLKDQQSNKITELNKKIDLLRKTQQDNEQLIKFSQRLFQIWELEELQSFLLRWSTAYLPYQLGIKLLSNKEHNHLLYKVDHIYANDPEMPELSIFSPIYQNANIIVLFYAKNIKNIDDRNMDDRAQDIFLTLKKIVSIKITEILLTNSLIMQRSLWKKTLDMLPIPAMMMLKPDHVVYKNSELKKLPDDVTPNLMRRYQEINYRGSSPKSFEIIINETIFKFDLSEFLVKNNHYVFFIGQNIQREREHLIESLVSEKFHVFSKLSQKITHDLANPLGGVLSLLDFHVQNTNNIPEQCYQDILEAKEATIRALKIIKSFARFATGKTTIVVSNLHSLITEALRLTKSLSRTFRIDYSCHDQNLLIKVDPEIFKQIIFNIVKNAAQACQYNGKITITTQDVTKQKGDVTQKWLKIIFSDNGPGIPPDQQQLIFQPLFTTKKVGDGTGIGLTFARKQIESWGGTFYLNKEYKQGAQFIIELPTSISHETGQGQVTHH